MIYENTKGYKEENGVVTGVRLFVVQPASFRYKVSHLRLIDEKESNGRTMAYCSCTDGRGDIYLTYPYASLEHYAASGGNNGHHPITNGYNPKIEIGPLSICVGKPCESEIVTGLGLPNNHHISFEVVFSPINEVPVEPPSPIEPGEDYKQLELRVRRIESFLNSWTGEI